MSKNTGIVNIRGREYSTVAKRVQDFRELHPALSLITEILHRDDQCVVMSARIVDEHGRVLATGHAEEYRKASEINRTSALENCETSAIGRALAGFGLGGTEFASADEVARAVSGAKGTPKDAGGVISGPGEVFKGLSEDEQRLARQIAQRVEESMPDATRAKEILEFADLEPEMKTGVWYLLGSSTRAALKRAAQKEAA